MKNKPKYLVLIFTILTFNIAYADEYPTYSIVELSINSDTIVEGKFIERQGENYYFLIKGLNQEKEYQDTLIIDGINSTYYSLEQLNKIYWNSRNKFVSIENSEQLLIYLSYQKDGSLVPAWSGFRLQKEHRVYIPYQSSNPGNFKFASSKDTTNWEAFKNKVSSVHKRISHIKNLKQIHDPKERNRALFLWLEEYSKSFGQQCYDVNADCGWGSLEWEIFQWITEGNIAKDTWKASQLKRQINAKAAVEWKRHQTILRDEKGTSFHTYADIDFLLEIAIDSNRILAERRQALIYLKDASRKIYEKNYPLPDSSRLAFQKGKQKMIRDKISPILNVELLKEDAFRIVRRMSNPMDGNLKHRIDLEKLPTIIDYYKKEAPSRYRSDLADFIAHNSDTIAWKKLSNSDAKIFMDLYQVYVDTTKNTLSFGIYYSYGRTIIKGHPKVHIQSLDRDKLNRSFDYLDFKFPNRLGYGVKYLKIDIANLEKGRYKVFVTGTAGEEHQYHWQSEYGMFEIK